MGETIYNLIVGWGGVQYSACSPDVQVFLFHCLIYNNLHLFSLQEAETKMKFKFISILI